MRPRRLIVLLLWLSALTVGVLLLGATAAQIHPAALISQVVEYEGGVAASEAASEPAGTATEDAPRNVEGSGRLTIKQWQGRDYAVYVPKSLSSDAPATLLLGFFPMGGNSSAFASSLTGMAEENRWLLVVPELTYGDWRQIEAVRKDDKSQFPWIRSLIDAIPEETGLRTQPRVLLYGFSRGAQVAHRFAIMYHDVVLAAAVMGAGTYTLPWKARANTESTAPLDYPMGVGDLANYCGEPFDEEGVRSVSFWVGVGANDDNPADVPRIWDAHEGATRVERATTFAQKMSSLGSQVQLDVITGIGHEESAASRAAAAAFLKLAETKQEQAHGAAVTP